MRKKEWLLPALLIVVVVFSSCREAGTESVADVNISAAQVPGEAGKEKAEEEQLGTDAAIYYCNSSADGLEMEVVTIEKITPEALIAALAVHNIVSVDTKVNSFKETNEGQKILLLDLSMSFGEYLKTMGTSGEAIIIAALTDTFLDAYQADSIMLTIDGEIIETGHAVYGEPIAYIEKDKINAGEKAAD